MELSSFNSKKFLIFSQKKAFHVFREIKLSYILRNRIPETIPYISGNRNPKKTFYISGSNFPSSKSKTSQLWKSFLYFRKRNFLAPSLKNVLCFRRNFQSPKNQNLLYFC